MKEKAEDQQRHTGTNGTSCSQWSQGGTVVHNLFLMEVKVHDISRSKLDGFFSLSVSLSSPPLISTPKCQVCNSLLLKRGFIELVTASFHFSLWYTLSPGKGVAFAIQYPKCASDVILPAFLWRPPEQNTEEHAPLELFVILMFLAETITQVLGSCIKILILLPIFSGVYSCI